MGSSAGDSSKSRTGTCKVCGEETKTECGRCKSVFYCSSDHQKSDWKEHKRICFPKGSVCSRCQQEIKPGSTCLVPHPEHLQTGQGSTFGGASGAQYFFSCEACNEMYHKSSSNSHCPLSQIPITKGAKWCYEGYHTIKPLRETDNRRVCNDVVVIKVGPDMQDRINALDGNEQVRVLKICSEGLYDSKSNPELAIHLPNLQELQTQDVGMRSIKLTEELTPQVQKIWMQNPTEDDEPDFTIQCPKLREFTCYYWGPGNYDWLNQMLEKATQLERFDSYKLRVGNLKFASNDLKSIRLHRAELLERIDLWAPRLTNLDVQAAYDLQEIHFLKRHRLKTDLPENFNFGEELHVNATNALLGKQAISELEAHPRFHGEIEQNDDFW